MSGQTTDTLSVTPSNSNSQKPLPFVLRTIMDIQPPNILDGRDDEIGKEKLCPVVNGASCRDGGGGGGSGGMGGVSASLTPTIWDKTIPYDGENFHLEYMDLEEFLLENQIPAALEEELHRSMEQGAQGSSAVPEVLAAGKQVTVEREKTDVRKIKVENEGHDSKIAELLVMEKATEPKVKLERATPSPVNPEDIELSVNFQPDPADLVLSSIPGGELFNPRKRHFNEDELKPQPTIKKAKKVFVSENSKDEKYWQRRKKNNVAAKRSRDARRLKENQIAVRANFLERENAALRQEVAELRKNCSRCKKIMALYEAKYGPL